MPSRRSRTEVNSTFHPRAGAESARCATLAPTKKSSSACHNPGGSLDKPMKEAEHHERHPSRPSRAAPLRRHQARRRSWLTPVDSHGLDRTIYHLVLTRASQINGYVPLHRDAPPRARAPHGETEDRLDRLIVWDHVDIFNEREKAALAWTEALTVLDRKTDYGPLRARLRQHFSDDHIAALTATIGMINFFNRLAISTRRRDVPRRRRPRVRRGPADAAGPRLPAARLARRRRGRRPGHLAQVAATAATDAVDNPGGWLTTVCTRRCIDMMRSAHRSRVEYVGNWLPEPPADGGRRRRLAGVVADHRLLAGARAADTEGAGRLPAARGVRRLGTPRPRAPCRWTRSTAASWPRGPAATSSRPGVRHVTPARAAGGLLAAFEAAVVGGHTPAGSPRCWPATSSCRSTAAARWPPCATPCAAARPCSPFVRDTSAPRRGHPRVGGPRPQRHARAGPTGPGRQHARGRLVRLRRAGRRDRHLHHAQPGQAGRTRVNDAVTRAGEARPDAERRLRASRPSAAAARPCGARPRPRRHSARTDSMGKKRKLRKSLHKREIDDTPALVICVGKSCAPREVSRQLAEQSPRLRGRQRLPRARGSDRLPARVQEGPGGARPGPTSSFTSASTSPAPAASSTSWRPRPRTCPRRHARIDMPPEPMPRSGPSKRC